MERVISYLKKRLEIEKAKKYPDDFVIPESVRKTLGGFIVKTDDEMVKQLENAIKILENED